VELPPPERPQRLASAWWVYLAGYLVIGLLVSLAAVDTPASANCPGGGSLGVLSGKRITAFAGAVFFRTSELQLDDDGSPSAYGVRDQGRENICNGLAPVAPPVCRGRIRGKCFHACQTEFSAWSHAGARPDNIAAYMCSVGLGGDNCSHPIVQLQPSPRDAWFVSETSAKYTAPDGTVRGWSARQEAQLDPERVPYFVIPDKARTRPWNLSLGDVGVVVDLRTGHSAAFVLGDSGGSLDEASVALHANLFETPPKLALRHSALGEAVASYASGREGDFAVVVFRGTAHRRTGQQALDLTPQSIGPWLAQAASSNLQRIGGISTLVSCAAP